jgi:hypothetical protein
MNEFDIVLQKKLRGDVMEVARRLSVTNPAGLGGPRGEVGPQGIQGEVGPEGPIGLRGEQGVIGLRGPKGRDGLDSVVPGPRGSQGDRGERGEAGAIGPSGEQGPAGDNGPQGPEGAQGQGYTWRGTWDNTVQYQPYDTVAAAGSSYVATEANIGENPVVSLKWSLMARIGLTGPQGIQGQQGEQGEVGPTGYSELLGAFTMPEVGDGNFADVANYLSFARDMIVFVAGLGWLDVVEVYPAISRVQLRNLGYPGNAAPGTEAPIGALVVAAGPQGPQSIVPGPPGPPGETTKEYVDSQDALRVSKAGDTMTGDLTIQKAVSQVILQGQSGALLFRDADAGNKFLFTFLSAGQGNLWFVCWPDIGGQANIFIVNRATGVVDFGSRPTVSGNALMLGSDLAGEWEPFLADIGWTNNSLRHRFILNGSSVQFEGRISGEIGGAAQAIVGLLAPHFRPRAVKNFAVIIQVQGSQVASVGDLEIDLAGLVKIRPLAPMVSMSIGVIWSLD